MSQDQYFKDFLEISNVKARYCRCLDTKDWAGYGEVFTDDMVMDDNDDEPPTRGRDAVVKRVRSYVETAQTAHHIHSPEMNIRGDEADVIWAMQDRVIGAKMPWRAHTGFGHYREKYVRQNGRWRIASLQLRYLIFEKEPL